jgi:lysophospholipase L1-like esterase
MKSWIWIGGISILGIALWLSFRLKMPERLFNAIVQPPEGKNWKNEVEKELKLYREKKQIIFLGDSHIEQCEWNEVFPDHRTGNRGIGGETTGALILRIKTAVQPGTSVVVLQIGVNDILSGLPADEVAENYLQIIQTLKKMECRIIATLPFFTRYYPDKNKILHSLNVDLTKILFREKVEIIELNKVFAPDGELLMQFSSDGVHLNSDGYQIWINEINKKLVKPGLN